VSSEEANAGDAGAARAASEAELAAMTSTDMVLQATVLLVNIGGRRLGLTPPSPTPEELAAANADRDLEQVRDAIDAVRGLMAVLERRLSATELRPLRDALSQLQMAYAREMQAQDAGAAGATAAAAPPDQAAAPSGTGTDAPPPPGGAEAGEQPGARRPGPAESSGRLWVPGR
jgi:hypothetical protein